MRFLQFYKDGAPALGMKTARGVVDLSAVPGMPHTMLELCRSGIPAGLENVDGPVLEEASLRYAPVVTGMEKILGIGLNYRAHAMEAGAAIPEKPAVFCKLANTLAAHRQKVPMPSAREMDYEAEMVLIMGNDGEIFAVTCGIDYTAREWARESSQWTVGKNGDGFSPIGPYAVTMDSLPGRGLAISCRVNGELRQDSVTDDMIFSPEEIVAYLMPRVPLRAGDIIFTGTPSGVMMGYPADKQVWLRAGDTVSVTLEEVGTLESILF